MTRKDYVTIARQISIAYDASDEVGQRIIRRLIHDLSNEFALENELFSPGKFFDACVAIP